MKIEVLRKPSFLRFSSIQQMEYKITKIEWRLNKSKKVHQRFSARIECQDEQRHWMTGVKYARQINLVHIYIWEHENMRKHTEKRTECKQTKESKRVKCKCDYNNIHVQRLHCMFTVAFPKWVSNSRLFASFVFGDNSATDRHDKDREPEPKSKDPVNERQKEKAISRVSTLKWKFEEKKKCSKIK